MSFRGEIEVMTWTPFAEIAENEQGNVLSLGFVLCDESGRSSFFLPFNDKFAINFFFFAFFLFFDPFEYSYHAKTPAGAGSNTCWPPLLTNSVARSARSHVAWKLSWNRKLSQVSIWQHCSQTDDALFEILNLVPPPAPPSNFRIIV